MSSDWAKAGDATLLEMVVASLSRYSIEMRGACSSGDCERYGEGDVGGREILGHGRVEWGIMPRRTKENKAETWWISN